MWEEASGASSHVKQWCGVRCGAVTGQHTLQSYGVRVKTLKAAGQGPHAMECRGELRTPAGRSDGYTGETMLKSSQSSPQELDGGGKSGETFSSLGRTDRHENKLPREAYEAQNTKMKY